MDSFARLFLDAARYEQWLRFYFMQEKENDSDVFLISVDPAAACRSRKEEPRFSPLLEALDGKVISLEHSRSVLFSWMGEQTGLDPESKEFAKRMGLLSSDAEFRHHMDMFSGWVQKLADGETSVKTGRSESEDSVPSSAPGFSEWTSSFFQWMEEKQHQGQRAGATMPHS